jgi:hypothetical protein
LVESLIHGLLLVADHPYRAVLDAPAEPARPAAVRDAVDIIETSPQMSLTTATWRHTAEPRLRARTLSN